MNQSKIPLVCIVGPTASGKTALSVNIAKIFDAEIVSADSMQIYKGMDIATAKPTSYEQQGVVHHMMDFLDSCEQFSVAHYCEMAHKIIKDINNRGKLPILVGGTGLYVDSLINNITFADTEGDEKLREELQNECDEYGVDRVGWVLANTVQNHPWDGRFRHYNKTWAQEYPIPNEPEDCTYEYSVNSHPEIVNGLIDQFRAFTQEQNESNGFGMQL